MTDTTNSKNWHLSRSVPVALILTILVQTLVAGVFFGGLEERVSSIERTIASNGDQPARLVRVETKVEAILRSLQSIENKLERIAAGGRGG